MDADPYEKINQPPTDRIRRRMADLVLDESEPDSIWFFLKDPFVNGKESEDSSKQKAEQCAPDNGKAQDSHK